jgi:putative secretion ATPase (PEP-CTERM system associated)
MYEAFYGFAGKPFQLNPDPRFYFDSSQHRRAMGYVKYGLHQAEGFIVVTGEVGAGKTTLLRNILGSLDREKFVAANLVSTQLDADDTLRIVAASFGVATKDMPKAELLLSLEARLTGHAAQGRRCLLIVDEAQNLAPRAVEELRMLSNFQVGSHALLQTFLVGQPEFRLILQSPQMMQLRQRVIAACHIGPLDLSDSQSYIEHRLRHVGWKGTSPRIDSGTYQAVHEATGGVPRKMNLLFDRLLLAGLLAERKEITAASVREVSSEMVDETSLDANAMDGPGYMSPAGASNGQRPGDPMLAPKLQNIEKGMKEFEAALHRVERGNQDNAALFRRLLDLVRKSSPGHKPDGSSN